MVPGEPVVQVPGLVVQVQVVTVVLVLVVGGRRVQQTHPAIPPT